MFKIDKKNNTIYLTRGDDSSFEIEIFDAKNKPYIPSDNDIFIFTVKKQATDISPVIEIKTTGDTCFKIKSSMTSKLPVGKYVYDIQIYFPDGGINTIIPYSYLNLCMEVGHG